MADHLYNFSQSAFYSDATTADPALRILPGVSLMTVGEAKGHADEEGRQIFVDDETLRQIFSCVQNNGGTVKLKLDHGSGVMATEGWVSGVKIAGDKLSGDLNFYESTDPALVIKIFEIARKNPTHLGISLEFAGPDQALGNKSLARCKEVFTAALVSDPAANKSLFEKKVLATPEKYCMSQPEPKKIMADEIKDPSVKPDVKDSSPDDMPAWAKTMCQKFDDSMAGMTALHSRMDAFDPTAKKTDDVPAKDAKDQPATEDSEKQMSRIVENTVKEMAAKLGLRLPAPGANDNPEKKTEEKTFSQLVDEKTTEFQRAGEKDAENKAMVFCIGAYKKEYAAQRQVLPNPKKKQY